MEQRQFQELFVDSLKGPLADLLDLKAEARFSFLFEDSFRYRARRLGLRVAHLLIDEKGELDKGALQKLKSLFGEGIFILGPGREGDSLIYGHIRNCLESLSKDPKIWTAIHQISPPLCHKGADELIRETLWPEPIRIVQTAHVRKAVIAVWFTWLRQATGSCFATAPAIWVQQKEPLRLFKDLQDLLSTGQMKRLIGGKEVSVPLNVNSGKGDLGKPAIGLHLSLGIEMGLESVGISMTPSIRRNIQEFGSVTPEEALKRVLKDHEGIEERDIEEEERLLQMTLLLAKEGAVYYQRPNERTQRVAEWKKKLHRACTTFKTLTECALLRAWEYSIASFSDEKVEFTRWNLYIGLGLHPEEKDGVGTLLYRELDERLQMCNREIENLNRECEEAFGILRALEESFQSAFTEGRRSQIKSEWAAYNLSVNSLLQRRDELLARAEGVVKLFPSWIEQYDRKLQEFFQELFDPNLAGEEADLYEDGAAGFRLFFKHGRSDASQWTAIYNADQYISALRDFFSWMESELEVPPTVERRWISEITTSLIQFIQQPEFLAAATRRSKEKGRNSPWDYLSGGTLQTLLMAYCNRNKSFTELSIVPRSSRELLEFLQKVLKDESLLMHSPTHAFTFYPSLLFRGEPVLKKSSWTEEMKEHIVHRLSERLGEEEGALFLYLFRQRPSSSSEAFRESLIESLRIKQKEVIVDALLYEHATLFSTLEAKEALVQIFDTLGKGRVPDHLNRPFYGSFELYQQAKKAILQTLPSSLSSVDWDMKIAEAMRKKGVLPPVWIFADTNWSDWFLGFVVNPANGRLELWRLNRTGTEGFPLNDWAQWLDEKNTESWTLLTEPKEYENFYLDRVKNVYYK